MITDFSPDPGEVRERETFNFVKLKGKDREVRVAEWRRLVPLLPKLLKLDYGWKLAHARAVIAAALERATRPAVAWSGGRGSTVLLDLVRRVCPDVLVLFANTRVEFPETVRFVRSVAEDWDLDLHVTFPAKGVTFWTLIEEFGLPLLGKTMADTTPKVWRGMAAKRARAQDGATGMVGTLFASEVLDALTTHVRAEMAEAVSISARCCYHLKERPQILLQRKLGVDYLFLGIQAEESNQRAHNYMDFGELYYARKAGVWKVLPLALWTRGDLLRYEAERGLPRNPLYDMGYKGTGCWPCMMDIAFSDSHAQHLLEAHPRLHRFLMLQSPVGEAIARLKAIRAGLPPATYLELFGLERLYEHPCWFNRV